MFTGSDDYRLDSEHCTVLGGGGGERCAKEDYLQTPLMFWPNTHSFGGFLITVRDTEFLRRRMIALGAVRRVAGNCVAYLWNFPEGQRLFSGIGVVDGRFVRGPVCTSDVPEVMVGYCALLELGEETKIRTDEFGMYPVFYSDEIVTDRLHLAMLASPEIDGPVAFSMFHNDWMFGHQLNTRRTLVEGFRMLGVGERLRLRDKVELTCPPRRQESLAPGEYHELIRKGAEEVLTNLAAVLDANDHVSFAITGGRDSRINLAALVALGRTSEVQFRTYDIDHDLPIGSGLVKWAGGSYALKAPVKEWISLTLDEALERRRSVIFGTYHPILSHHLHLLHQSGTSILIGGGMGEAFRPMYTSQRFGAGSANDPFTPELMQGILRHLCAGESYFSGLFDRVSTPLKETFDHLHGESIAERLDDHYLNFRNRLHFRALYQASINGATDFHPLMSPSLLRAARGLPYTEKATMRVLYDVTRALCPELARYRYDKPWPADMTESPYFDPTCGPADPLPLDAAPDLVTAAAAQMPKPLRLRPEMKPFDLIERLEKDLEVNLANLASGPFGEVAEQPFRRYLDWAKRKDTSRWLSVASKVQTLADLELVAATR